MVLTNEQLEEKINEQSEQIDHVNHELKEVRHKVDTQSAQTNKIDIILELQQKSAQDIDSLNQRMSGVENTLERIESTLKSLNTTVESQQQSIQNLDKKMSKIDGRLDGYGPTMQKIPDLIEKVGELKNWRQIVIILMTALLTWYLRGVNLKP